MTTTVNPQPTETLHRYIVQANQLMRAGYKMTLQEKRILSLILSRTDSKGDNFEPCQITVVDAAKCLGRSRQSLHSDLDGLSDKIMSRVLKLEDPHGGWVKLNFLRHFKWRPASHPQNRSGMAYFEAQIHEDLRPYLLGLQKNFSMYELADAAKLSSFPTFRLFEFLYDIYHSRKAHALNGVVDACVDAEMVRFVTGHCDEIRELTAHARKGSYKRFPDYRRYVLEPAEKEIPKHTGLQFSVSPVTGMRGRVEQLVFSISYRKPKQEAKPSEPHVDGRAELITCYQDLGLKGAEAALAAFSTEQLQDAFPKLKEQLLNPDKLIASPGGYILSALKNGCGVLSETERKKLERLKDDQEARHHHREAQRAVKQAEQQEKRLEADFKAHWQPMVDRLLIEMDDAHISVVYQEMSDQEDTSFWRERCMAAANGRADRSLHYRLKRYLRDTRLAPADGNFDAWRNRTHHSPT